MSDAEWRVSELTSAERDYALAHLAQHLLAAGRLDELTRLAAKSWLDVQVAHGRGKNAFLRDVSLVMEAAASADLPRKLRCAWRCAYIAACVRDTVGVYPPRVARLLAHAGRMSHASSLAELVPVPFQRCLSYCGIAKAALQQRNHTVAHEALQKGLTAAMAETPVVSRAEGLALVAAGSLEACNDRVLRAALDLLSAGEMGHWMGRVISDLATAAAQAARPDVLRRLLALARRFPRDDFNLNNEVVTALAAVAGAMAKLQMRSEMTEILTDAVSMPEDTYHRGRLLVELVGAFVEAGDAEGVKAISDTLDEHASLQESVDFHSAVAEAHHRLGDDSAAEALLESLCPTVEAEPERRTRDGYLHRLAQAWAHLGRYPEATRAAESVEKPQRRADALRAVGAAALVAGDASWARTLAAKAVDASRLVDLEDFEAIYYPVETALRSAKFAWEAGIKDVAVDRALELLRISDGLCDPMYGPDGLKVAMEILACAGHVDGMNRAIDVALDLQDSSFREEAMAAAVIELAKAGDLDRAISLAQRHQAGDVARVAEAAFEAGHRDKALGLLGRVLQETDTLPFDNAEAIVQSTIARELALRQATAEAEVAAVTALDSAKAMFATSMSEEIGARGLKALVIAQVARTLSLVGRTGEAVAAALEAWAEANPSSPRVRSSIGSETWEGLVATHGRKGEVIGEVARVLTRSGRPDTALTLAGNARDELALALACDGIAAELDTLGPRSRAKMLALVRRYVSAGGISAEAAGVIEGRIVQLGGPDRDERAATADVERDEPRPDRPEIPDPLIDEPPPASEAEATAPSSGSIDHRLTTLLREADLLHQRGQLAGSMEVWSEACLLARDMGRPTLLGVLRRGVRAIADFGGVETLAQLRFATTEVTAWWRQSALELNT